MLGFRPPRSSSPAKSITQQRLQVSTTSVDASHSSAFSAVPELAGLSTEEVQLIDVIIERAGPTATTFLTVFKAYNDILVERGLDPHEVVYYGKLLKLGTLKGSSWREKWDAIKVQNGYETQAQVVSLKTEPVSLIRSRPVRSGRPGPSTILSDDLFSSGSALRRAELSEADDDSLTDGLQAYSSSSTMFPSHKGPSSPELTNNSLGLEVEEDIQHKFSVAASRKSPWRRTLPRPWRNDASEPVVSTPLSYRAVPPDPSIKSKSSFLPNSLARKPEHLPLSAASKPVEKRNGAINEEDAWKKVKAMQDEREADRFRDERLVERCFDVWRQGFRWITTTNEQIDDARGNLLLRKLLQRWNQHTASRHALCERVDAFANRRCERTFFSIWKQRLKRRAKEKLQAEWRQDMRMKVHFVRQKRDKRILKETWHSWRRSHQLAMADQYVDGKLVARVFHRWRARLREAYDKEAVASDMYRSLMDRVVEVHWDHWRLSTELVRIEKVVKERVGWRIMGEALDTWKKKKHDVQIADSFFNVILAKRSIRSWKTARDRLQRLEVRATKHIGRQDDVLLRAVMRVWKAHERGKLLGKVRALRLTKTVWAVWKVRLDSHRKLEELALHFSMRLNSSTANNAFSLWRNVLSIHQNAHLAANRYHSQQVLHRSLLQWRLQLHTQLKMAKEARMAERFLVLHRSWNTFNVKYRQRIADKKFQTFQEFQIKKIFNVWFLRSQRERQRRLTEDLIRDQIRKRILSNSLTHWTNRVIEIKVQELEVSQRNEAALLTTVFKRWKNVYARHVEEMGLMQSYQDIKREESARRIFSKWLITTRAARHRRDVLRQKEEEIKLMTIAVAWDRWRERFQEERLRPLEHTLLLQNKEILKYRAFATWLSKTQSLPAIHFDSKRVKVKHWKIWMSAMPRALQAKTAREADKKAVLKKFLEKWLQVYRTKLSLKAVARARYFPAPISTRPASVSRPYTQPLTHVPRSNASRNNFPRRVARSPSPDAKMSAPVDLVSTSRFAGLRSRLVVPTRTRSEASPTRTLITATRASSPARSTKSSIPAPWYVRDRSPVISPTPSSVGRLEERNSLWQELRDVRRTSQTPSEKS